MPIGNRPKPKRLKVVMDTNVLVSGLNFGGRPREVLDLTRRRELELCLSPFILAELKAVLQEDFGWSEQHTQEVTEEIRAKATLVEPQIRVSAIKDKEADNRILECAVAAEAQYIISGDRRHLLPLKEYQGIVILSPTEFLKRSPFNSNNQMPSKG